MEKKKLSHKVTISQCGKEAVFHLSDKELNGLRRSSIYTAQEKERALIATYGRCYNFSMYAFFEYETSYSKCGRFSSIFNYHKGDFFWYL
jgi:hypothetical protein